MPPLPMNLISIASSGERTGGQRSIKSNSGNRKREVTNIILQERNNEYNRSVTNSISGVA